MEENKNKENNAESYDFMADAKATIKGLIGRTKEHGLFKRDDDGRVLVCIAFDIESEKSIFTANGIENLVVAGIVGNIIHNGLSEKVKKAIDMYEREELKNHAEGTEYKNAEEVQDAEPAAEPVGEE